MEYTNDNCIAPDAEDQARVLRFTTALAKVAGWEVDQGPILPLPPEDWCFNYVPTVQTLLLPTTLPHDTLRPSVTAAVRRSRSDALVLGVRHSFGPPYRLMISVCTWAISGTAWYGPHQLWIDRAGECWLVPSPQHGDPNDPCFLIGQHRLMLSDPPYTDQAEKFDGFSKARVTLREAMEG